MLEWGRGAGKSIQIGAPTLGKALDAYLARPTLRSEVHKNLVRQQFALHLKDWMKLPLTEITKAMVVERHRLLDATPSGANHLLNYVRKVWNNARRTHDLPESPTMAIDWFEEQPSGGGDRGLEGPVQVTAPPSPRSLARAIPLTTPALMIYSTPKLVRDRTPQRSISAEIKPCTNGAVHT